MTTHTMKTGVLGHLMMGALIGVACEPAETGRPRDGEEFDERDAHELPFSLCEENGWACEMPDRQTRDESRRLEVLVEELDSRGEPLERIRERVEAEGHQATVHLGAGLMYWVEGGVPRSIWRHPELTQQPSLLTRSAHLDELEGQLGRVRARLEGVGSTRTQRLSVHGVSEGFERQIKQALIYAGVDDDPVNVAYGESIVSLYDKAWGEEHITYHPHDAFTIDVLVDWVDYDAIHISAHGVQAYSDLVGRTTSWFALPQLYANPDEPQGFEPRSKAAWKRFADVSCDQVLEVFERAGVEPRGLACTRVPKTVQVETGEEHVIHMRSVLVSSEFLAQPGLNNRPLVNSLLFFDACSMGRDLSKTDFELIASDGVNIQVFDDLTSTQFLNALMPSLLTEMFERGVDLERALDELDIEGITAAVGGEEGAPVVWTSDERGARLIEVVRLEDPITGTLSDGDSLTLRPEQGVDSTRLDVLKLVAGLYGVDEARLGAHEVGVFIADEDGRPAGEVLEPGWIGLEDESAQRVDEERELWLVDLGEVTTPFDLRGRAQIELVVVARLPEGGESRWSYRVELDVPGCPTGHVSIEGETSARANATNYTNIVGLESFTLARAAFDPDEQPISDGAPAGSFFVRDVLPSQAGGEVALTDVEGSVGFNSGGQALNVAFGPGLEDEDGEIPPPTGTIRLLPDGSAYEGRLEGMGLVSRQGASSTRLGPFSIQFRTGALDDPRTPTSCYVYPRGR